MVAEWSPHRRWLPLLALAGFPSCVPLENGGSCPTEGITNASPTVSFKDDVRPLMTSAGCLSSACHGGTFPSSRYDLRTYASSFIPGDLARRIGACAILPGDPDHSFMVEKLRSDDPRAGLRMPLEHDPLTEAEIQLIETWILEGAADN